MEPDACLGQVKQWIIDKKRSIYDDVLKNNTGATEDLSKYEGLVMELGYRLMSAITKEDPAMLKSLDWPDDLVECIKDPSTNIVVKDFIDIACIRFPSTNSEYNLKKIREQLNSGLE